VLHSGLKIDKRLIRRRYALGVDSIIRLFSDLLASIADSPAIKVSEPERLILAQKAEIARLEQTIHNKDKELVEVYQLNHQLQRRIRELEKAFEVEALDTRTAVTEVRRDSHNSNQPPSFDLPWIKPKRTRSLRKQSKLKVGGQIGHKGVTLRQVAKPNRIIVHQTDECQQCGVSLAEVAPGNRHKRQIFEIENGALAVIEHRLAAKICPNCDNVSRGQYPANIKAPVQYGTSVLSRALYLHLYQLVPVARTQEAMRDLFGCYISQASIQRAARFCSDKLIRCEQRIKQAIRESEVIGADETGIRINGANAWVHIARTDTLTHLATHPKRGKAAFDAIGILNQFKGTLVRDGWFSYKQYDQCKHSLCNAHLLRDLLYVGEAEPPHEEWTDALAKLLIEIKSAVEKARNNLQATLEINLQTDFLDRYDRLTTQAAELVRRSPPKKGGLTARGLLNRFIRSKAQVLRFMTDLKVPFDNNGSERDLRMLKLQQKIAGCFRSLEGVRTFCRVRSYLSSARKQNKYLLSALEYALKGKPIALTN
jgi:transposase